MTRAHCNTLQRSATQGNTLQQVSCNRKHLTGHKPHYVSAPSIYIQIQTHTYILKIKTCARATDELHKTCTKTLAYTPSHLIKVHNGALLRRYGVVLRRYAGSFAVMQGQHVASHYDTLQYTVTGELHKGTPGGHHTSM